MTRARILFILVIASLATYPMPRLRIATRMGEVPLYVPLVLLLAVAVAVGVALRLRVRRDAPVWWITAAFLAALAISTLLAGSVDRGLLLRLAGFVVLPPLALQAVRTEEDVRACTVALLAVCVFVTAYGWFGFVTGSVGVPSEHALAYWGIRYLPSSRNSDVLYPVVGFLLAAAMLASGRVRPWSGKGVLLAAVAVATGIAVLLSRSRSGWVGLAAGVLPLLFARRRGQLGRAVSRLAVVGVGVAAVALLLIPPEVMELTRERAASLNPSLAEGSNPVRLRLLTYATWLALTHPLGVGAGNIGDLIPVGLYGTRWAENAYLNTAVELGLLGGLALAAYVAYPIWLLGRRRLSDPGRERRLPHLAVALGLAVYLVFNVEVVSMFYWVVSVVVLAAAVVATRGRRAARREGPGVPRPADELDELAALEGAAAGGAA